MIAEWIEFGWLIAEVGGMELLTGYSPISLLSLHIDPSIFEFHSQFQSFTQSFLAD